MGTMELTVIIPTLNEEDNIGKLCAKIKELYPDVDLLVVDDGSTDRTQQLAREAGGRVIDRTNADVHGLSISIAEAINRVKTQYFMVIDGDFQHPPESLKDAIECIEQTPELIVGRRDRVEEWPFSRRLLSWGAQTLAWWILLFRRRQRPSDIMSGFFGGRTKYISDLLADESVVEAKGYKILFDILKVLPRDARICEFGYVFRNREFGDSKIGKKQIFAFLRSLV